MDAAKGKAFSARPSDSVTEAVGYRQARNHGQPEEAKKSNAKFNCPKRLNLALVF
jgi:hypothetical protein